MKKSVIILAAVGLVLGASGMAGAAVTFNFDPNDLLGLYPATAGSDTDGGRKIDQDNPRRLRRLGDYGVVGNTANTVDTFWNPDSADAPNVQPKEYNTYRNWLDGLGSGEGIASFNIWLANGGAVKSWGETLVTKPGSSVTATADTANGWNAEVVGNPWVDDYVIVRWYTDDSAKYLRPGGDDIGEFSFTADSYIDAGQAGWDVGDLPAVIGDDYRIWFGSQNGQESDRGTGAIFFDSTWGTGYSTAYDAFAATSASGWESVLTLTAVPEPASVLVWCLLGAGSWLGMRVWRRRRVPVGQQPWSAENRQAIHEIITR